MACTADPPVADSDSVTEVPGGIAANVLGPNWPVRSMTAPAAVCTMAVIADGRARDGETLHIPMPDRTIPARVVKSTVFYDPEGSRLNA